MHRQNSEDIGDKGNIAFSQDAVIGSQPDSFQAKGIFESVL